MPRFSVNQWDELSTFFTSFFRHVSGNVEQTGDSIRFKSPITMVETSLHLFRDGTFGANMPLHGIESKVETVDFQTEPHRITFIGQGLEYIYQIPTQLIVTERDE